MGLDFTLHAQEPFKRPAGSGIFIRESGRQREMSASEWNKRHPDRAVRPKGPPEIIETTVLYHGHITHNVCAMAQGAGIYWCLWRPEEYDTLKIARDLTLALSGGLGLLYEHPQRFIALNPEGGWGSYEVFTDFVEEVYLACHLWPNARIEASR